MKTKRCRSCAAAKDATEFGRRSDSADGLRSDCKACVAKRDDEYRRLNPEKVAAAKSRWHEANKERDAATMKRWQEKIAASDDPKSHYRKHYAKLASKWAARKARAKKATPLWADAEKTTEIYRQASRMRRAGLDVHVDHEIPLKGKNVSGLHVHNNLRIIPARENLLKGNRLLDG